MQRRRGRTLQKFSFYECQTDRSRAYSSTIQVSRTCSLSPCLSPCTAARYSPAHFPRNISSPALANSTFFKSLSLSLSLSPLSLSLFPFSVLYVFSPFSERGGQRALGKLYNARRRRRRRPFRCVKPAKVYRG